MRTKWITNSGFTTCVTSYNTTSHVIYKSVLRSVFVCQSLRLQVVMVAFGLPRPVHTTLQTVNLWHPCF